MGALRSISGVWLLVSFDLGKGRMKCKMVTWTSRVNVALPVTSALHVDGHGQTSFARRSTFSPTFM